MLRTFDFPAKQGKAYKEKTDATQGALTKYAQIESNKRYGKRISMKMTKPDHITGFKDEYLSGTHLAYRTGKASHSTKASDAKRFLDKNDELLATSNKATKLNKMDNNWMTEQPQREMKTADM